MLGSVEMYQIPAKGIIKAPASSHFAAYLTTSYRRDASRTAEEVIRA